MDRVHSYRRRSMIRAVIKALDPNKTKKVTRNDLLKRFNAKATDDFKFKRRGEVEIKRELAS
jgi:hypothetical protein